MLLLKYPNVYTDTATAFMDSPKNYYEQIFWWLWPGWLQNNLMDMMYGSNLPDFARWGTKDGLEKLNLRPDVLKNPGECGSVLGMKGRGYDY